MRTHQYTWLIVCILVLLFTNCKNEKIANANKITISDNTLKATIPDSSVLLLFHNASKYNIAKIKFFTSWRSSPKKKYQEKTLNRLIPIGYTDSLYLDFFNPPIYGIAVSFIVGKDTIVSGGKGSDMYTEGGIIQQGAVLYDITYNHADSSLYLNRKIISK